MSKKQMARLLASAVFLAAAPLSARAEGVKIGVLRCDVSSARAMIIASNETIRCAFVSTAGYRERYFGDMRKFGLDVGATNRGRLEWLVLASATGPRRGALAGEYSGVDASATLGARLGANVLVGGFDRSITLRPLSVQAPTGLALAAGVESLNLRSTQ